VHGAERGPTIVIADREIEAAGKVVDEVKALGRKAIAVIGGRDQGRPTSRRAGSIG